MRNGRKLILCVVLSLFMLMVITIMPNAKGLCLEAYDSDPEATYYFDSNNINWISQDTVRLWVKIIRKEGFLPIEGTSYYIPLGIECSFELLEIKQIVCKVEIQCKSNKYRIMEGFYDAHDKSLIFEPPPHRVGVLDIPMDSSVAKLSNIVCRIRK